MFCSLKPNLASCFLSVSSRCEAELVGKQAEGQKRAIELSLSALRSQEEEACLSLQRVKEEVQQHKQQLHKLKSEQKKREKQALKYVTQCTSMYVFQLVAHFTDWSACVWWLTWC